MSIYLGLGANEGDRRANMERAIQRLVAAGFRLRQVSPIVESPALLMPQADSAWHKPYLNLVVRGEAHWQPQQGLAIAKRIEKELGRQSGPKWAPRPVDIDLLLWHDRAIHGGGNGDALNIPHADASRRDFVLTPLMHLQPDLRIGAGGPSAFELTRAIRPIPLWMAIINLTPDSFSDGGAWRVLSELDAYLDKLIERHVQIIDFGAESTRPGGQALTAADEWARLEPTLRTICDRLRGRHVRPWLSVDSRHPASVEKALGYGIDMINDVTGLRDPEMMAAARLNGCQVVAMHSLGAPVNPALRLPERPEASRQISQWVEQKMEIWAKAGLDLNRIILDPGIGFGKTSLQAFELLSHCRDLRQAGLRLLVGHSRKSFMSGMSDRPARHLDLETLGISLALCRQGVDIIRVHAPFIHQRAYLAWAHVTPPAGEESGG